MKSKLFCIAILFCVSLVSAVYTTTIAEARMGRDKLDAEEEDVA